MIIIIGLVFFNISTIAALSADIYNQYQKKGANGLIGRILSTIGGIEATWMIILIILRGYFIPINIIVVIIIIIKAIGLVLVNQILVINVANKGALIFWITITILDCIVIFATILGGSIFGYGIFVALCLLPKLLTAISAIHIVIKGLCSGSNQEQTTFEMNVRDPPLSYNML